LTGELNPTTEKCPPHKLTLQEYFDKFY
jgi:hypothetical protein